MVILPDEMRPVLWAACSIAIDDRRRTLAAIERDDTTRDARREAHQLKQDITKFREAQLLLGHRE